MGEVHLPKEVRPDAMALTVSIDKYAHESHEPVAVVGADLPVTLLGRGASARFVYRKWWELDMVVGPAEVGAERLVVPTEPA